MGYTSHDAETSMLLVTSTRSFVCIASLLLPWGRRLMSRHSWPTRDMSPSLVRDPCISRPGMHVTTPPCSPATLDGGIGYLLPIPEKVYRRLLMLQAKLSTGLPHCAGLNPKSFRVFQSRHQYLYNPQRNILDGGVLACYTQLGLKQKTDFAKQIGTSPAQILDDLKELDKITTHF